MDQKKVLAKIFAIRNYFIPSIASADLDYYPCSCHKRDNITSSWYLARQFMNSCLCMLYICIMPFNYRPLILNFSGHCSTWWPHVTLPTREWILLPQWRNLLCAQSRRWTCFQPGMPVSNRTFSNRHSGCVPFKLATYNRLKLILLMTAVFTAIYYGTKPHLHYNCG